MSRALVMEGSLEEFDLVSVLQTVSIGRQYTGIELQDEAGEVVGTMYVKAGQVLAATAEGTQGIDAVRRLVRTRRSHRFRVFRERGGDVSARIGSIADVLLQAIAEEDAGEPEAVLMEGSLREFDLRQLLEAVSLGRQCVGIDLFDERERRLGAVCVKAGQILGAEHDQHTGARALGELLHYRGDGRFVVFKTSAPPHASPLLAVADLAHDSRLETLMDEPVPAAARLTPHKAAPHDDPSHVRSIYLTPPSATAKVASDPKSAPIRASAPTRPLPLQLLQGAEPREARRDSTLPPSAPLRVVAPSGPHAPVHPPDEEARGPAAPLFRHGGHEPGTELSVHRPFLARTLDDDDDAQATDAKASPVIAVTSPKGGSGQTTVALNLAVALARREHRVALLDASGNGLLIALDADRPDTLGLAQVLAGRARLEDVALTTRIAGLTLYPTGEGSLAEHEASAWAHLLDTLREQADLVLVDCPAGLEGATAAVLSGASHALTVLAAEPASLRALARHEAELARLPDLRAARLGLVLNQLDYQARASLHVLEELCAGPDGRWVFDVPIPRSPAFLEASSKGVPIAHTSDSARPTIGWVFELLASSVLERLGMLAPCLPEGPLL